MLEALSAALLLVNLTAAFLLRGKVAWGSVRNRRPALLLGAVAGLAAVLARYPLGPKYVVLGFPLPAAAFEKATGADFVSPLTVPMLLVDLLLIGVCPAAVLVIHAYVGDRKRRAT